MEPLFRGNLFDLLMRGLSSLRGAKTQHVSKHRRQRRPKSHVYGKPKNQARLNSGRKHWKRWAKRQARKSRHMRAVA